MSYWLQGGFARMGAQRPGSLSRDLVGHGGMAWHLFQAGEIVKVLMPEGLLALVVGH